MNKRQEWQAPSRNEVRRIHHGRSKPRVSTELGQVPVAVVVLLARKNRVQDLEPLLPELGALLNHLPARALRKVGG